MPTTETQLPELKVLKRKEPDWEEDSWPQFDLHDAEVRDRNGALTSLFSAATDNPVTLTGNLDTKSVPGRVLAAYKSKKSVPVIIANVTFFAYGIYDSGHYALWAAGQAGWHTIMRPTKAYAKIHRHMTESLQILYFLIDSYDKGKKTPTDDLFQNYAQAHGLSSEAAKKKFYAHAEFLAGRMMKGEEGIRWGHTSFYQHLRKVHPEAFEQKPTFVVEPAPIRTRPKTPPKSSPAKTRTAVHRAVYGDSTSPERASRASRMTRASAEPAKTTATRSSAARETSRTQSREAPKKATRSTEPAPAAPAKAAPAKRPLGRPRKASQQETKKSESHTPTLSEQDRSRAKEVWKFIQKKSNDTLPEIAEMTIETFGRFLYDEYVFADEKEAQYFLKYLAPDLVGMMSIPRNRSYDPWTELPIYDELMEAKVPGRSKGRIAVIQLKKRETPLPGLEDNSEASDESSEEEEVMNEEEAKRRKKEHAHRRISALRPKSGGQYSGKAAKRKGKEKAVPIDDDEDDEENEQDEEMQDVEAETGAEDEDRMSVDTPSKRKSLSDEEEEDEEEASPEYPNKRFTRSRGDVDPELQDLEFEAQQARSTGLAIRRKASVPTTNGTTTHRPMALRSEPMPSTEANAVGDIWMCPQPGCVHKVYGASEYENKELIREHIADHKDKERTDLVKDEEFNTQLPVSHLLKRIREIAERADGARLRALENGMMGLFPPSLERKVY